MRYAVDNREYPASLERGKVYRMIYDSFAQQHDMVRIVDESEEDYLFPQKHFKAISLPRPVVQALAKAV